MTQKELFEKLQNIIDLYGVANAILAIEIMYKSYTLGLHAKENEKLILHIKDKIIDLFISAEEYKFDREIRERMKSAFGFDEKSVINKSYSKDFRVRKENVADTTSIFYDKVVVFTGDLDGIKRNIAAEYVHSKGGIVRGSISSKTDIVVIGSINPGPEKLRKLEDLITSGVTIMKINEKEFFNISGLK